MRVLHLLTVAFAAFVAPASAGAKPAPPPKPWCAPEVNELADHVCYFDGTAGKQREPASARTLVIYLHGSLAPTPGFQWLQQRAMALHAKRHDFTVLLPTSPMIDGAYVWPTGRSAQQAHERAVLAGLASSKKRLEQKLGVTFDETFVVGFSSGAYYGSSVAIRGALDVDGYIFLAGGSSWAKPVANGPRAPIFVGVSASDAQTADDSRALASTLRALAWPLRVSERNVGHMVDWTFMAQGLSWLRAQRRSVAQN